MAKIQTDRVICAACERELMPDAPPMRQPRMPLTAVDSETIGIMLAWLQTFTFTPMQAEHLMVILRGQVR